MNVDACAFASPTASGTFDWRSVPLAGRQLIEASAGTGKTYTILLLVLRALLETDTRIEQVVVTTYTRAAAMELKVKLRDRLQHAQRALDAMARGEATAATDIDRYLSARALALGIDEARRRIRAALLSLELAAIDTLHALCGRILRDEPLAAPMAFDGGAADAPALARECLEDLWRGHVLGAAPLDLDGAAMSCTSLLEFGFTAVARALIPLLERAPVRFVEVARDLESRRDAAFDALRGDDMLAELDAVLADAAKEFKLRVGFSRPLAELASALKADRREHVVPKELGADCAADSQHKKHQRPLHASACIGALHRLAELDQAARSARVALALQALAGAARAGMSRRAQARDMFTFANLIDATESALAGSGGAALATRLRERWPIALIDEFQDTDQQQFAVCTRLWDHPDATLLLIGDPKQAIYGFRGADLHAYLEAAAALIGTAHRLDISHRASARLVEAVNAFYVDAGEAPFGLRQLAFAPLGASGRADARPLRGVDGAASPPLRLHLCADASSREALDRWSLESCADDIASALAEARETLAGEPLHPGNIAVLLPAHRHVARLRELLAERGVPSIGAGRANVWDSVAAECLIALLRALVAPDRAPLWRAALTTPLFGATLADIRGWQVDPAAWNARVEQATRLAWTWRAQGIAGLLGPLIAARAAVVVSFDEGERLVTDLRHLLELLAAEESRHGSPQALLSLLERAFQDARAATASPAEERNLRIDSDARRVRLMTVHVSKGLEFDIVYLPLAWRLGLPEWQQPKVKLHAFHDDAGRAVLDAGLYPVEAHVARARAEALQEALRLQYVSLTRARHACHVFWGSVAAKGSRTEPGALDSHLAALARHFGTPPGVATWSAFAAAHANAVTLVDTPSAGSVVPRAFAAEARSRLVARGDRPGRPLPWSVSSFTRLVRDSGHAYDPVEAAAATDEVHVADDDASAADGVPGVDRRWRAFRGTAFGNALHQTLERSDWQRPLDAQPGIVTAALASNGVGKEASEALLALAERTLTTPLFADGSCLRDVPACDRRAELRFDFALRSTHFTGWPALFAAHGCAHLLPALPDSGKLTGLLTGAIDLLFRRDGHYFVADYKSNDLGAAAHAYAADGLLAPMQRSYYGLQMTLYQLAVHRYLRQRISGYDYARDVGGSLYLFVRGLDASGDGVFRERLPFALIEALDADCAGAAPA